MRGTAYLGFLDKPQHHCFTHTQALQLGLGLKPCALLSRPVPTRLGPRGAFRSIPLTILTHPTPFFTAVLALPSFPPPHIPGMPLAILVFIIGGGLAVPAFAFSHHMAMFKGK